jgi:hypothetical protein
MVPRLKISSIFPKEKYFRYLPYLYHLFARGRATSKHGGGGRYNAILEFKRGANKKIWERKNDEKKERKKKKEKSECKEKMRKEKKIYEYVWYKNKIKWTPQFSKVH